MDPDRRLSTSGGAEGAGGAGSTTGVPARAAGLAAGGGLARRGAGRGRAAVSDVETGALAGPDLGPPLTEATSVPQAGHDSRPVETRAPHDEQAIGFLGNSVPL